MYEVTIKVKDNGVTKTKSFKTKFMDLKENLKSNLKEFHNDKIDIAYLTYLCVCNITFGVSMKRTLLATQECFQLKVSIYISVSEGY